MAEYLLGMSAKVCHGAEGSALAAMTELTKVKDVTLNMDNGEADVTTRDNSGWRATAATLADGSADFEMVVKPTDTGYQAIRDAWQAKAPIGMAFLTAIDTDADSEGPVGDWTITKFSRSEPLEEAITVSVTAKLVSFTEWHEG